MVKKIFVNLILLLFFFTAILYVVPSSALAASSGNLFNNNTPAVTGPQIGTSTTPKSVEQIAMDIILDVFLPIIGGIALIFVIYGGVMIIISSGDPEKLAKAKKTLLWAVIGIIIVVLSYGLVVSLSKLIEKTV